MRAMVLWVLAVAWAGCAGEVGTADGARSWSLEADDHGGLVDRQHPEFGSYPNPRGVDQMLVTLHPDGRLCAAADGLGWCGGVLSGIPYRAAARLAGGRVCLAVVDLYGNRAHERCGADEAALASAAPPQAGCTAAATRDGRECRFCTDETGAVTENTCGDVSDDSTIDEFAQDGCAGGDAAILTGARLYVDAVNDMLERAGLDVVMDAPADVSQLIAFEDGDLELGEAGCDEVLEYLDDEFSDDDVGEDFVFGDEAIAECQDRGRCRIGQIVTRAMAVACSNIPEGCNARSVSTGIIGAGGETVQDLCESDEEGADGAASPKSAIIRDCVGSPLVLDLAGDGLRLQGADAGARFALFGGPTMSVGWVAPGDDALLAIDLDGDGVVSSGLELFGEAGGAHDGFVALARYDDNGDGAIDAADPVFERLLAWRDDGDGRCEPSEIVRLDETGVLSIPVVGAPLGVLDASGNELGLQATAAGLGGRSVPVVDVWFQIGR